MLEGAPTGISSLLLSNQEEIPTVSLDALDQKVPQIQQPTINNPATTTNVHTDLESLPNASTAVSRSAQAFPIGAKIALAVTAFVIVATAIIVPVVYFASRGTQQSTTSVTISMTTMTTTSITTITTTSVTTATTTSVTTATTTSVTTATTTSVTTVTTTTVTTTTTTSVTSETTTTETTTTTTSQTTVTTTTETTSTSETTTTTSAPCPSGYTRTPSGSCVDLLIDFNNCGSIGYVCNSTYTSCSNGACSGSPAVQLVGGVSVPGWGGSTNIDDAYLSMTVPFNITLYNMTTSTPSVQSNGCVCLGGCSNAWSNGNLPDGNFADATAFGFWDDLYIYAGSSESVYYGTIGTYPNRSLVYEFYTSHYGASSEYYHFQIVFYEAVPNIVDYVYYQISDGGSSATIGVQYSGSGPAMTYSVNQANAIPTGNSSTVTPTLILTFDTNANIYTTSG